MGTLMVRSQHWSRAVQGLELGALPRGCRRRVKSRAAVTPRCRRDAEPHRFNYTSANFIHLVKPGSYRKIYFQVCCLITACPALPTVHSCMAGLGRALRLRDKFAAISAAVAPLTPLHIPAHGLCLGQINGF